MNEYRVPEKFVTDVYSWFFDLIFLEGVHFEDHVNIIFVGISVLWLSE